MFDMHHKRIIKLFLLALILFPFTGQSVPAADTEPKHIKIAVIEIPPLVFKDFTGFCIDLANIVCEKNDLIPDFVMFNSVPDLLDAVESGNVDMGFSGITITPEREKKIDFSQPFFESGLMIAIGADSLNPFAFIGIFILEVIGFSLAMFFIGWTVVAHLIWWIERDDDDPFGFPVSYSRGIVDAYWWAVVTMSTVGYGDKRPKKIGGRVIAAVWIFIGIIWFAGLTATLTSALTVDRLKHGEISDLHDLYDRKVAVIEDTISEDFMRFYKVRMLRTNSLDELLTTLKTGTSDAIVHDAPPLLYAAKSDPAIKIVGNRFAEHNYGIVFPNEGGEELKEIFDVGIMRSKQNGDYKKIFDKWF